MSNKSITTKILDWISWRSTAPKPMRAKRFGATTELPKKKLRDYPDDETLRARHPAVQDAWSQYQMLIKLNGGLKEEEREALKRSERRVRLK